MPILAHVLDLSGWLSENPIFFVSGLRSASTQGGLLSGQPGWVDGNAGVTTQALGYLSADDWLHGIMPWWNPYCGLGVPLAGQMQPSSFFLPFVLLLHLPNGITLLKLTLQAVAGLGMLALLREMKLGWRAALTGSVLAELCGTFAWFSDAPSLPIAFLPWMLFGLECCAQPQRARLGIPVFALALAYSVVAGFPETAYLDGLLALLWAAVLLATSRSRLALLARIALAGTAGLLLSAPASIPFLVSLPSSFVSVHTASFGTHHAHRGNAPMLFFPYARGALLAFLGPRADQDPWWEAGGYAGTILPFLALAGLLGRGPRRPLAAALGLWIALCLGRSFGLPLVTPLFNAIPAVRLTVFDRYVPASCECAAIILAAFALDDLRPRRIALPALLAATLFLLALLVGRTDLAAMLKTSQRDLILLSLAWGTCVFACAVPLLRAPKLRTPLALLACLDAFLLFETPLLAGARHPGLDTTPIPVLRRSLGLARFASLGGIWPNYGAMFRLAGINSNLLPSPRIWADHLRHALMPESDGQTFFTDASGGRSFLAHASAYEADGVALVLALADSEPFHTQTAEPPPAAQPTARPIDPGASLRLQLPPALIHDGDVDAIGVTIGTYAGRADGALAATLCQAAACTHGAAPLAGATDNARLVVRFPTPLALRPTVPSTLTLTHAGGTSDVAIWTGPRSTPVGLTLFYRFPTPDHPITDRPIFVTRVGGLDIYRLPHPAPYFSTGNGHCTLTPRSRTEFAADCPAPTTLTRLELFAPGWRASIDRHPTPISPAANPIFQSVHLPAGHSTIRFTYAPPGATLALSCVPAGCLLLLATLFAQTRALTRRRSRCGI